MKHSVQQQEVEESDEDPHREIPHRVKRFRKVEEARRRPRPRRVEEVPPTTEDDREKMDEDPWNKPFPVEELTQYHPNPNRQNPSSNSYRRHRDDKYSSGNYVTVKPPNQYISGPNKQLSRHSLKPIGSSQRDSSELQAIYGGSVKVEQRRSSHHIHKKPSASRAPLANVQPTGQHYAPEYQNDRFSSYDQDKSYRTYRDGRQAKNVYNPEERHYMHDNPRPRQVARRPSPRNELVYTPVMETKRSNVLSGRPGLESKIPIRNYQPSISRIPHPSTKRLEPYETQYNTSQYEKYRGGYRDEGRGHIQRERDVFSEKSQQKERQRKSQVFPPGRPGQQYQMEPTHISVAERLGLKPPKKPSASRVQHGGSSIRTQQHYGVRI